MVQVPSTEAEVLRSITDYLTLNNIYHLRLNSGKVLITQGLTRRMINLCPEGTPDIFALKDGKAVFLEVKRDAKVKETWLKKIRNFKKTAVVAHSARREIEQYKAMKTIEAAGGDTYLVASLGEVMEIFK